MNVTDPEESRALPRVQHGRAVGAPIAAPVIIAAFIFLAACGGEQPSSPAQPLIDPRPTATSLMSPTAGPTWQPSPSAASAATPAPPPATEDAAPTTLPALESGTPHGLTIFQDNCAVCHGAGGEGQPDWHLKKPDGILPAPPLNGDGHTWHHGDGTLYTYVSRGGKAYESPDIPSFKSGMPSFGETLTHEDIIAVIEYVKSLWGDKVSQGLELLLRETQAVVSENDPFPSAPP